MKTKIQERRIAAGVSLRELAKGLGPGYSPARLNLLERALAPLTPYDERAILEAIDKLSPVCAGRRRIVETAKNLDLRQFVREAAAA